MAESPKRVGIVVSPTNIFCRQVVHSVAAVGAKAGWEWLLAPTEGLPLLTDPDSTLDGVIGHLEGVPSSDLLFGPNVPVVDFSSSSVESETRRVTSDDMAVGRLAAAYLLSLGLTHYGYLGWRGRDDSSLREQGFLQTLVAAGFPCESFLWPAVGNATEQAQEPSAELVRWVSRLKKPVGVFATNDRRAVQMLAACRKLGIAVPESVAILGVENDEMFCELANPSISSIALSTQRIGYEAARMLERMMRTRQQKETRLLIPPAGVVPRASTRRTPIIDPDVAAAVRYIAMHVQDNIQVADVLHEVLVSRRSLDQRFLKALGRTPAQEISRAQLEVAKQALSQTGGSMDVVAAMAGFKNAKQLGATFRSSTGMTPTAYRQQSRI
ncbi:AraC family transcriptional regulator [Humisphaera borealis]|uniref:DNA-binding transcriptional regulator n=1 Tax=Humisphaera borealis TaxID=2807512 RepID=A0A7M2WU68_9BACT|nr:DNA-binding transcriptional regulator [Humisphaera borealis]QOV89026.1 DNA-binding transcriptional regulator [Humisphaera borealis]